MMDKTKLGPNAKRLLMLFMAREAIPPGGSVVDGFHFFTDAEHRKQVTGRAWSNFNDAVRAIRAAPDNPYGDDEEAICSAILDRIDK